LAEILERQGRHEEAIEMMKAVDAEKLSNSQLLARLADFLLRHGHLSDAETAYRKAIEIKPGVDRFQKSLAFVLLRLERVDEALNILQQLVKDGTPDPQVHARLGEALAAIEAKAQLAAQR
jgi:predicted Zn-dependent protease